MIDDEFEKLLLAWEEVCTEQSRTRESIIDDIVKDIVEALVSLELGEGVQIDPLYNPEAKKAIVEQLNRIYEQS